MSPRLRRFTSRELLVWLRTLGFEIVATRGSHAKLRRLGPDGERQTLTVHVELAAGTIAAIFRQVCRYVPEAIARPPAEGETGRQAGDDRRDGDLSTSSFTWNRRRSTKHSN